MANKTFIKEIFETVQGEGPYVGCNQLFIRFSQCNLSCQFCDTDFTTELNEYSAHELAEIVNKRENLHSVSLTGGEPLLEIEFLKEFLPLLNKKVLLETNGTLYKNLEKIIDKIDIVSMDIKLPSTSGNEDLFEVHKCFIDVAKKANKEIYIKVVFDENITEEEIKTCTNLAKENDILLVLQPKMDGDVLNLKAETIHSTFYKFAERYHNVRLIPQVHKFLNLL